MATRGSILESCPVVGVDPESVRRSVRSGEFDRFASRVSASLLRSAFLLTGDRGHAEDLLQETLWRTARRWHVLNASPEAYAREVLVNLSRDRRRASKRRPSEITTADAFHGSTADGFDRVGERDEMVQAVRRLARRQREVVVLRFFLDLSVEETAATLGTSQGTVKSYTVRALDRMRHLLAENTAASQPVSSEVRHGD